MQILLLHPYGKYWKPKTCSPGSKHVYTFRILGILFNHTDTLHFSTFHYSHFHSQQFSSVICRWIKHTYFPPCCNGMDSIFANFTEKHMLKIPFSNAIAFACIAFRLFIWHLTAVTVIAGMTSELCDFSLQKHAVSFYIIWLLPANKVDKS